MTTTKQIKTAIELTNEALALITASEVMDPEMASCFELITLKLELAKARVENRELRSAAGELAEARAPRRKAGRVVEVRDIQSPAWTRHGVKHEGEIAQGHHATIEVGKSIRLHGIETNRMDGPLPYDRTFELGDTVACDSYNLTYLGVITGIGAKTVTIEDQTMGRVKRLSLYEFSWRNRCLDLERIAANNADTLMAI